MISTDLIFFNIFLSLFAIFNTLNNLTFPSFTEWVMQKDRTYTFSLELLKYLWTVSSGLKTCTFWGQWVQSWQVSKWYWGFPHQFFVKGEVGDLKPEFILRKLLFILQHGFLSRVRLKQYVENYLFTELWSKYECPCLRKQFVFPWEAMVEKSKRAKSTCWPKFIYE